MPVHLTHSLIHIKVYFLFWTILFSFLALLLFYITQRIHSMYVIHHAIKWAVKSTGLWINIRTEIQFFSAVCTVVITMYTYSIFSKETILAQIPIVRICTSSSCRIVYAIYLCTLFLFSTYLTFLFHCLFSLFHITQRIHAVYHKEPIFY